MMLYYIIITEDGSIFKTNQYGDPEIKAVKNGVLTIIDTFTMTEFTPSGWVDIPEWENGR